MKMKASDKAIGIPTGIALGTLISVLISLGGAAVTAWLVSTENVGEGSFGTAAMVIVALAAAVGAWLCSTVIKRLRLQMCLLSGACYFLSLLGMTALFFDGQYQGIGKIAIVILCACTIIAFLPSKNKPFKAKMKKRHR